MKIHSPLALIGIGLLIGLGAGCQTPPLRNPPVEMPRPVSTSPEPTPSSPSSPQEADIPGDVHSVGPVPVWIYVPWGILPGTYSETQGITGQIALPQRGKEGVTNTIRLMVQGQVAAPGPIQLPVGSTILEAISQAGGFTWGAGTKRLKVVRVEENAKEDKTVTEFRLFRHFRPAPGAKHQLIWYQPEEPEGNPPNDSQTDFELQDGDTLIIDRII